MIAKTRAIVIKNTNYAENSVVSKMFTDVFGVQSYLINGVRNNKGAIKSAIIQPINMLELEVYHKPHAGLQRIREARPNPLLDKVHQDIAKSCVAMFVLEVLNKSLHEEEPHEELFAFLTSFILFLNNTQNSLSLMPHYFLLEFSKHLGFFPELEHTVSLTLDLQEGRMVADEHTPYGLQANEHDLLVKLNKIQIEKLHTLESAQLVRSNLLLKLIKYYQIHIVGNVPFKSIDILNKVLHPTKTGTSIATN